MFAGDGIFNTNGDLWKQQRKTGVRIFTKRNFQGFMNEVFDKNAREYAFDFEDVADKSSASLEPTHLGTSGYHFLPTVLPQQKRNKQNEINANKLSS